MDDLDIKKRNEAIFWDKLFNEKSLTELGKEHNLSRQQISLICFRQRDIQIRKLKELEDIKEIARAAAENLVRTAAKLTIRYDITSDDLYKKQEIHVANLELTMRTFNVFKLNNIRTLSDLEDYTELELLRLPNFGRKSLEETKELMREYGYKFRSYRRI
jgi:DNA-directed RNA polymerase alpha subunit